MIIIIIIIIVHNDNNKTFSYDAHATYTMHTHTLH